MRVVAGVGITARNLPIVRGCPIRGGLPGDTGAQTTIDCARCAAPVHDLTRRSEGEVRRLLAAHVGRSICVQYRVRPDGDLALREARLGLAVVGIGALLTACAGRLDELAGDPPVDPCELGRCRDAWVVAIPDQVAEADHDPDALEAGDTTTGPHIVANFSIDPDAAHIRGAIVIGDEWHDAEGRLRWLPTSRLIAQWLARMRERRRLRH